MSVIFAIYRWCALPRLGTLLLRHWIFHYFLIESSDSTEYGVVHRYMYTRLLVPTAFVPRWAKSSWKVDRERERVFRSKWIMKRNRLKIETVISLREKGGRRKERKRRRKEKYFPKGNSVERFAIVVAHCRFIVAYWIVESIQNFTLFLSLSLYTVVILNRTRREKRFESYI